VNEKKYSLLIVEDDQDIADMLNAYFRVQGYEVLVANWGEDGVKVSQNELPDLIILDIRLPDFDGYEVARQMRANRRTQDIPIIFLTEKRERDDRLRGLALHAEDYITKPFDIQELRLRVRNALRRNTRGSLTNPVTNLPEGDLVDERLRECQQEHGWGILVVTLDHFNEFRESYGFVASDDLLRAVAMMLHDTIREHGSPNDFLGHLAPNSFLLVIDSDSVDVLKERIRKRMDVSMDYFNRDQDRQTESTIQNHLSTRIEELRGWQELQQSLETFKSQLMLLTKGT
jgi:PleD family two-component response regulator